MRRSGGCTWRRKVRIEGAATRCACDAAVQACHCCPLRPTVRTDPALRKKRKQQGGNSGKNFTEGWVEFEDKQKAKEVRGCRTGQWIAGGGGAPAAPTACAAAAVCTCSCPRLAAQVVAMLNGQQMGGKRRSAYYYDLWCLRYLPKFKWDHLTEEINYQKAVQEQRLAAEVSAAKRERDFYLRWGSTRAAAAWQACVVRGRRNRLRWCVQQRLPRPLLRAAAWTRPRR